MNTKTMITFAAVAVVMAGLGIWSMTRVCQVSRPQVASVAAAAHTQSGAACYCLLNIPAAAIAAAP